MNEQNGTGITDDNVIEIVKKKQRRPKRSEELAPQYEPGDMTRMIGQALGLSNLGEIDINKPEQVQQRINAYFRYCMDNDLRPSVESMALAFNTNRTQLWRWVNGVECNISEASRNAIKKGYAILNQLMAQTMMEGRINPVSAIFLMKNNMNYKDQTDVVITPNNPYQGASEDELKQKYLTDMTETDG